MTTPKDSEWLDAVLEDLVTFVQDRSIDLMDDKVDAKQATHSTLQLINNAKTAITTAINEAVHKAKEQLVKDQEAGKIPYYNAHVEKLVREARIDELERLSKSKWADLAYDIPLYLKDRIKELRGSKNE